MDGERRPSCLRAALLGSVARLVANRTPGATVTAVRSGSRASFVRGLGAAEVVDRRQSDVTALDRRWGVILDIAGNRRLSQLRWILAPRRTLVLVGGENGGPMLGGMDRVLGASSTSSASRRIAPIRVTTPTPKQ